MQGAIVVQSARCTRMFDILLDAEVFRRENLHFSSKRFSRLVDLVNAEEVTVYVTDVTVGEIRAAIRSSVHAAAEFLKPKVTRRLLGVIAQSELANVAGVIAKLDEAAIIGDLQEKFDRLLEELSAVVISTDDVPVAELRKRYFEATPPFAAAGVKKNEFPDALSILAAEQRAQADDITLFVVSADSDVAAAVEISSALEHVETLQEMVGRVLESVAETAALAEAAEQVAEALADEIAAKVEDRFLERGFYVENEAGEVTDVTVRDIDLGEPTVAELSGNVVKLEFTADVSFDAEVTIDDPDQTAYDSETGDTFVFGHLRRDAHDTEYVEGEVEIEINLADLAQSRILSLYMFGSDIGVTFPYE